MIPANTISCPVCAEKVERLLYRFHVESEQVVIAQIKQHNPDWSLNDGICSRCVDYYQTEVLISNRQLPEVGPFFPIRSVDDFVIIPTPLRLDVDPRFTGRGITICFIDSGYHLHPDLVNRRQRILHIMDMTKPERDMSWFNIPHPESWHGTMTTVVCAGDGYSSNGLYKGIANEANLVLLKVSDDKHQVHDAYIETALQWILENHSSFDIRIVNISVGGSLPTSSFNNRINELAEKIVGQGIVVVAAAGNDDHHPVGPPASAPSVISVGGCDDGNAIQSENRLYHSSYSKTAEGYQKPEIIAPAIWISAPILPGSREQKESETLHQLLNLHPNELRKELVKLIETTELPPEIINEPDDKKIRQKIMDRITQAKYISPSYMHVDGSSFASPIICAVIAQMMEANPDLGPAMIRKRLFESAKRLSQFPAERQGFGIVQPRKAVIGALKSKTGPDIVQSPQIDRRKNTISFFMHHECASKISLSGDFNRWDRDTFLLQPAAGGLWQIEIPMLPTGKYVYKFFVDEKTWMEDFENPFREPDGFNGFNSVLEIVHHIN